MKILEVRNVHEALPRAIKLLQEEGIQRDSRNGPVLQMPCPVTTVYTSPLERVIFWPERDANPFFHLFESLWMLHGRNDIASLVRYAKRMADFSDDGITQHGAYGYRWRRYFGSFVETETGIGVQSEWSGFDQLVTIAERLKHNPEDRRCILQMWDCVQDLGIDSKDVPCNTIATFQRNSEGALDLTVFCRSNDIIWGAYGANAVHFSMLLEYMANWIGCPVGRYYQVSVNWHGYLKTLEPVKTLPTRISKLESIQNPYRSELSYKPITGTHGEVDLWIKYILRHADAEDMAVSTRPSFADHPWANVFYTVLEAHEVYRKVSGPERYSLAIKTLMHTHQCDWSIAAKEWLQRRLDNAINKEKVFNGELSHP